MAIKIINANIVTAFSSQTIGTKVINPSRFEALMIEAISQHDVSHDRENGQHFIQMPEALETVSAGVGVRTVNTEEYVIREYRGVVDIYLKREFAAAVESLAVIVYTVNAYLSDPDVNEEEVERIKSFGATHVLVAVLASAGPRAPLSPKRFVHNLAGGNREAIQWSGDEIRTKSVEVNDYHNAWCVVAD